MCCMLVTTETHTRMTSDRGKSVQEFWLELGIGIGTIKVWSENKGTGITFSDSRGRRGFRNQKMIRKSEEYTNRY